MIHNEYMQEIRRMNWHNKTGSMDLLTPRSPNSAVPLHAQKQCTTIGSSWGSSIPVSDH